MDESGIFGSNDKSGRLAPVRRERSRVLTFRVSSEEFEVFTRACASSGSRSLSAFARDAVLDMVHNLRAPPLALRGDLTTLTKALVDLDTVLCDARKKIRRVLRPGGPGNDVPDVD